MLTTDCHIHVFPDYTAEQHLAISRPSGVSRTVIIQPGGAKFDNSYMLAALKAHPGVFSAVAIVDADAAGLPQTVTALYAQGVRGFRIHARKDQPWVDWQGMRSLWTIAAQKNMVVCPLINPDALPWVADMCQRHPRTLVALDHFARVGATGSILDSEVRALCALAKYPRVHVKVSAFYALGKKQAPYTDLAPMIRQVFETYGPRRLLWGSDAPYQARAPHRYRDSVELVRGGLPFLGDEDKEWILARNSGRLFFPR
ncbi:MAG: amidohydrolase family protein [Bryobacterales bacterium]|nr:amidohydrolase family protein [Bryobacterales bacterium]